MNTRLLKLSMANLGNEPEQIQTIECDEKLVGLNQTQRLILRPIWDFATHDDEAEEYRLYIKEHPAYKHVYVRESVANMLYEAAQNLPANWQLVIAAGHRPLEVQKSLYAKYRSEVRAKSPSLTEDQVDEAAREYVADPSRKPPGHCCGAAVDVNVFDATRGQMVDFGSPINSDSPKSNLHSKQIPKQAQQNRLILLEVMLTVGFSSLASEWWHFSYGDQNWAAFYSKPNAIYGLAEPTVTNS